MGINREDFKKSIKKFYTKEIIYSLYKFYFINWIADGYIGHNLNLFDVSIISMKSDKNIFIDLLEEAFYKKETFVTIFHSLDEDVKTIFESIIWSGKYSVGNTKKKLLFQDNYFYESNNKLKDKYKFFHYKKNQSHSKEAGYLYIDNNIIRKIRPYFPDKIKDYFLHPIDNPSYAYEHSAEKEIVTKYSLYYNFYTQNNIEFSSNSKLLKSSKKEMQKQCNILEYYSEDRKVEYIKTETIGLFFHLIKKNYLVEENFKFNKFKYIIGELFSGDLIKNSGTEYIDAYLNYLKGVNNIKKKENLNRLLQTMLELIIELPSSKIMSIKNITNYLIYRDKFLELIDEKDAYDYIYVNESNYGRIRISEYEKYREYIIEPFIKSFFFLLGSLGLFKLYYDLPSGSHDLYLKSNYLTKFDGLKYIKLTPLCEYVFGKNDDYSFKIEDEEDRSKIVYDINLLHITIIGYAPIKSMLLDKVAIKIGTNSYKMDSGKFLKNVNTEKDLDKKIEYFKSIFFKTLPEEWKVFFRELKTKANYFNIESDIVVFKINKDKDFLKILSTDVTLKDYIIKAEGFRVLIKKKHLKNVKEILLQHGYFNDML